MLVSTPQTTEAIKKNNRTYKVSGRIELINLQFDKSLSSKDSGRNGSIAEQLTYTHLPYVPDRLHIGTPLNKKIWPKVYLNTPSSDGYRSRSYPTASLCGYIGWLDTERDSEEKIFLRLSPSRFKELHIQWATDRCPQEYIIYLYDKMDNIIWQFTEDDRLLEHTYILETPALIHKICVWIKKQSKKGLRPHLLKITPAFGIDLSAFDIVTFKIDNKKDSNGTEMGGPYISTLDLTIFNAGRLYDIANSHSPYYRALRKGASIHLKVTLDTEDGLYLPMGLFFATEWKVNETTADVKIKASSLLSYASNYNMKGSLLEEVTAAEAFRLVAQALSLKGALVDINLEKMLLYNIAINGQLSDVMKSLCAQTMTIAFTNDEGDLLIIKQVQSLVAYSRYPLRHFFTNEYSKFEENVSDRPNTLMISYSLLEFEGDKEGEILIQQPYSDVWRNYSDMTLRDFPVDLHNKPWERPIGAGLQPSWTGTITVPERFLRLEFSDEFLYETLEYLWEYTDVSKTEARFKVWLFSYDDDKVLTVYTVVRPQIKEILNFSETIPVRPSEYVEPDLKQSTVEKRNWLNAPYTFDVKVEDKSQISNIIPGNYQQEAWFEFIIDTMANGCSVRAWNYAPTEVDFSLSIQGRKIIEGDTTYSAKVLLPDLIAEDGVVEKEISLPAVSGKTNVQNLIRSLKSYYSSVINEGKVDIWSDPRLVIGDRVAFESLRGYEKKNVIIKDISLNFDGALKQTANVLIVSAVNRDSRVCGAYILRDRPVISYDLHQKMPNDGIY